VLSDLNRSEVKEEGNLLIEAVALLVQRQRETESWVAEQIWQSEERAAATDRRYAELEARLEGIEQHLARLVHEIEPTPGDTASDERLARLREQVEGLKLTPASAAHAAHSAPIATEHIAPVPADGPAREPESARPALPWSVAAARVTALNDTSSGVSPRSRDAD